MEGSASLSEAILLPEIESHGDDDLDVSKLPMREGWSEPLVPYNNYWMLPRLAATIKHLPNTFKPRHDDIVLAAYPKRGTTWIKAFHVSLRP
jgi:estrone sulfotransferase